MPHQAASSQTLATYLTTGYWQEGGMLAHSWNTSSSNAITVNLSGLTLEGKALARTALDAWETVVNISFKEVTSGGKITFDDNQTGAFGSAGWNSNGDTTSAHVNVSTDWLSKYGTSVGSYSFQTYMHEIGHALGLGHPGHYDGSARFETDAKFSNDCWQQTIMSYFDQDKNTVVDACYAQAVTPMMADILAIQALYGAATGGPTGGNTIYGVGSNLSTYLDGVFGAGSGHLTLNALTVFDQGGVDTINFRDDTQAQQVNLGAGKFSNVYGLTGNLGIAYGTTIENYVAGYANDRVMGNAAGNTLKGMRGNDALSGNAGADKLFGGSGADKLYGGYGNDLLKGGTGRDLLSGGGGYDRLFGGKGADKLTGGVGADDFIFCGVSESTPRARDIITDFTSDIDQIVLSAIDANASALGNQDFRLDANGSFSAGEIQQKVTSSGLLLQFNTDGDSAAEMAIFLQGVKSHLTEIDFIL